MLIWKRWRGDAFDMPPLHWTSVLDYGTEMRNELERDGGKVVAILCCKRGHSCALRVGGSSRFTVSPSVQCPVVTDGKLCDGHEGPPSQLGDFTASS